MHVPLPHQGMKGSHGYQKRFDSMGWELQEHLHLFCRFMKRGTVPTPTVLYESLWKENAWELGAWVEEEITKRDKNARRKGPWKMEDWLHQGLMMVMREEKSLSKIKNNNNKNLDQISTFPTTREGGGQKMKRLRHQTIKCLWLAVKSSGIFLLDSRAIIHVNHLQKTHHPKYSLL